MSEPNLISITQAINERPSAITAASNSLHEANAESSIPAKDIYVTLTINQSAHHSRNDLITQQIDDRTHPLISETLN